MRFATIDTENRVASVHREARLARDHAHRHDTRPALMVVATKVGEQLDPSAAALVVLRFNRYTMK